MLLLVAIISLSFFYYYILFLPYRSPLNQPQIITSDQSYIGILERTNQQLSLWYNPYGIMITVLTILIAFSAIIFTFLLWRQGKDYGEKFDKFLEEERKIVNGEITKSLNAAREVIDKQIEENSKKLKGLKGETKEIIEKEIAKLKEERRVLQVPSLGIVTSPESSIHKTLTCRVSSPTSAFSFSNLVTSEDNICPHCHMTLPLNYNLGVRYCCYCGKEL